MSRLSRSVRQPIRFFMDVEVKQIKEFQEDMLRYFEQIHPEIVKR